MLLIKLIGILMMATKMHPDKCSSPDATERSLAPGKFEWNFRHVIFKQILVIDDWGISCEITLTWKPQDFTDDKSTLVQVMAWCHQATSHYLSQCWPSSLSPYGVTRPQWVKELNNAYVELLKHLKENSDKKKLSDLDSMMVDIKVKKMHMLRGSECWVET